MGFFSLYDCPYTLADLFTEISRASEVKDKLGRVEPSKKIVNGLSNNTLPELKLPVMISSGSNQFLFCSSGCFVDDGITVN